MKKLFVLFFLPMMAFTVVGDWKTVKIDSRVSIDFPEDPQQKEMSGNDVWIADVNDHTRCMAMLMDFANMGIDSAGLAKEMGEPNSFADFRNGVLGQIAGSKLISERNTTFLGYKCFEYVIDMGKSGEALNKMYNRNIFIGSKMYSLSFYESDNKPELEMRKKFFASFKLN